MTISHQYTSALRDLLNPKSQASLRVREHPKSGPYVEHLQWLAVGTVNDVSRILNQGYRHRTTASTVMNDESSRSHAIFQAIFTQIEETTEGEGSEEESRKRSEKVSKISLVDLAGSERQSSETLNQSQMDRLNEGCHINKALSALSNCISALYRLTQKAAPLSKVHVPFRDSPLTWLLKESLGGNSKTVMIAAISPNEQCYEETYSTLQYASRAKRIRTHAVVNEDINKKIIRELRAEVEHLREQLEKLEKYRHAPGGSTDELARAEIEAKINSSESTMLELSMSWEQKVARTNELLRMDETGGSGAPPSLINLADDAADVMLHFVPPGDSTVGSNPQGPRHMKLSAPDVHPIHAVISYASSQVSIRPHAPHCVVYVNGLPLPPSSPPFLLQHGTRIGFGDHAEFRLNLPWEAARNRARIALDSGSDAHTPKRMVRERSSGVGIVLQQLGKFLTVVDIKPFSVAERNGEIAVGQCIVRVNGADVTGMTADDVVRLLDTAPTSEDLVVAVKSIDDFSAAACDVALRPATQSVPFAINPGTPEQKIEPTSDSSDDDAAPLDMGDDISGDDDDDGDGDDQDDDGEVEPLDKSDDFGAESSALAASVKSAAAALSPITVSPTFSPSRDRRVSTGSAGRNSNGRRASGVSHASGSSQDSPAVALECDDDVEGDDSIDDIQSEAEALNASEEEETEFLGDSDEDVRHNLQLKKNDDVSAREVWAFVSISRRSLFDTRNQTRSVISSITLQSAAKQQQVVDVDMDLTWRGVYSVARSNYGQVSQSAVDDSTADADGPRLLLSTPQLRKSVIKVLASKMESVDVSAGSVCMHAVCTSVMREMVQLGIVSYVVPETSRDIFSSDVEIDYASEGGVFKIKAPQISSTGIFDTIFCVQTADSLTVTEYMARRLYTCLRYARDVDMPVTRISSSAQYGAFGNCTSELQSCHIPPPSAERHVFFANIFNTLMLHGMLAKNVADGQNFRRVMETFMSDVQYRINGSNYSLRSIISEFGFIGLKPKHSVVLRNNKADPRVLCVLYLGTASCAAPKVLQVCGWEEQLITATVHFVKNNVRFVKNTGSTLEVSKLLKWNLHVFGGSVPNMIKWIAMHSNRTMSDRITSVGRNLKIRWIPWDWAARVNPFDE